MIRSIGMGGSGSLAAWLSALLLIAACAGGDPADEAVDPGAPIAGITALDTTSNRLGPALQLLRGNRGALTVPVRVRDDPERGRSVQVFVEVRPNARVDLAPYGATEVARRGDVYTAFIPIDRLGDVAAAAPVKRVRAARKLDVHLDLSVPSPGNGIELSAPGGADWGTGVLAGVVDTGLYDQHPDFTDGAGSTRVVNVWAQYLAPKPYAGTYALTDSPSGDYANNTADAVTKASPLDLLGRSSCILELRRQHYLIGADVVRVQTDTGGGWTDLTTYTGYAFDWAFDSVSLASVEGNSAVELRFLMETDGASTDLGWFADEITVRCADGMGPAVIFSDGFESGMGGWTTAGTWDRFTSPVNDPSAGGAGMEDTDGHGTNVTAIMAGRGVAVARDGVARNADIAVVGTTLWDPDIIDGVEHIFQVASGRGQPVAVNLSLGGHAGPHDGTDPFDRALDTLTGPGQIIVTSAGNEGDSDMHVGGIVDSTTFESIQYDHNFSFAVFDIWHDSPVGVEVRLRRGGTTTPTIAPGFGYQSGNIIIINYAPDPSQPTNLIYVENGDVTNNWQIEMRKLDAGDPDAAFNGWLWCCDFAAMDTGGDNDPDSSNTIGTPGTAFNTISVAAYVTRDLGSGFGGVGELATFSSRGPTTDGRTMDMSAPGGYICAACSLQESGCGGASHYLCYAGTSQASPHIAGLAVIALQQNSMLGTAGVRSLLWETANVGSATVPAIGTPPSNDWGWGKADADPLVAAAIADDPSSTGVTVGPATRGANTTLTARGGAFASTRNGAASQRYAYQWQEFSDGLWRNIPYAHYRSIAPDQFAAGDTLRVVATPVEYLLNGFHGGNHDWFFGAAVVSGAITISGDGTARGYTPNEEWTMVSVPTADIAAAGFLTNPLYEWNEVTQTYAAATTITNGRGYFTWIEPSEGDMSSAGAAPGTSDFTTTLTYTPAAGKPGRHLVGNPFPFPIYWQNLLVDGEPVVSSSKVQNYYYGNYSNGSTQYHVFQVGHLDGKIPPWTAVWVTVFEEVTLTIPYAQDVPLDLVRDTDVSYYAAGSPDPMPDPGPPAPIDPELSPALPLGESIPRPAPVVDWQLQIHAFSGDKRDDYNYVGLARDADDGWDRYDVYDPGTLSDAHVVLAIDRGERKFRPGAFCRDVQLMRRRASWPVTVSTKGLAGDATLVWGDVPEGWVLELVDETASATVDMASTNSYVFTPAKGAATRRFTVNARLAD